MASGQRLAVLVTLLAATAAAAADGGANPVTDLLASLAEPQRGWVRQVLDSQPCDCGCSMAMAECMAVDPLCPALRGMPDFLAESARSLPSLDALAAAVTARRAEWSRARGEAGHSDGSVRVRIEDAPLRGLPQAAVEVVVFSSYRCRACAELDQLLASIMQQWPGEVRVGTRYLPLASEPGSELGARAALAADQQARFGEVNFHLRALDRLDEPAVLRLAERLGLDRAQFCADLASPEVEHRLHRDAELAARAGARKAPVLFVDGELYEGELSMRPIREAVASALRRRGRAVPPGLVR